MAEPLKNQFGRDIPVRIAEMMSAAYPGFDSKQFVRRALKGYDKLELTPRGWQIAEALHRFLPDNYREAIAIMMASLGPKNEQTESLGMAPFIYMPHVFFVAKYGLDDFETSMQAQYELTQRFTAEFSIRPFLERYTEETFARLKIWALDPNVHVRRLVSEGTRPRLPWAPRLRMLQKDPAPVLALLELLKDDPELYVRRSVANNLNDIGKDHPSVLVDTTRRWMKNASKERQWLIRHALRSAIKKGDPGALKVLGFGSQPKVSIHKIEIAPPRPAIGGSVTIAFQISNSANRRQGLLVDCRIHFIKANGSIAPKVFKLKTVDFGPGETIKLKKSISLADMTTRRHYPGKHIVEAIVNGKTIPLGAFHLIKAKK